MGGRTAGGLVLIAIGVAAALWGINFMNSFSVQLGNSIGMRNNTGEVALGLGVVLGIIGLALASTKGAP